MNLVQRMVAENRQSVTSQELAEASGMDHTQVREMIFAHHSKFEQLAPLREVNRVFTLDIYQTFFAVQLLPMSEEEEITPEDELKADLKASFVKILRTTVKAAERTRS